MEPKSFHKVDAGSVIEGCNTSRVGGSPRPQDAFGVISDSEGIDHSELICAVTMTMIPGVGSVKAKQMLHRYGSFKVAIHANRKAIETYVLAKLKVPLSGLIEDAAQMVSEWKRRGEDLTILGDSGYPFRLSEIPDPPIVIHSFGRLPRGRRVVGIVGTRRASEYGKSVTKEIVSALREYEVQVVSGLAFGVDIEAHQAALDLGVENFGVIGSGLGELYPACHRKSVERMLDTGGGLISEYGYHEKGLPRNFPMRNRIIAGLCDVIVVVESMERGGALITAHQAFDYDREVMAVPGGIHSSRSAGCNRLIRENKARLFTSVEDLIGYMGWTQTHVMHQGSLFDSLGLEERNLMGFIKNKVEVHLDELKREFGMASSKMISILTKLELEGWIICTGNARYRVTR